MSDIHPKEGRTTARGDKIKVEPLSEDSVGVRTRHHVDGAVLWFYLTVAEAEQIYKDLGEAIEAAKKP